MKFSISKIEERGAIDLKTRLEFLVVDLQNENENRRKTGAELERDQSQWQNDLQSLDPADEESLSDLAIRHAVLGVRQQYHNSDFLRKNSVNLILNLLPQVAGTLQQLAEPRNSAESTAAKCFWQDRLGGLQTKERETQIRELLEICREVCDDLRTVLQEKRGVSLSAEERREGILRHGAIFVRRLSSEECATGFTCQ